MAQQSFGPRDVVLVLLFFAPMIAYPILQVVAFFKLRGRFRIVAIGPLPIVLTCLVLAANGNFGNLAVVVMVFISAFASLLLIGLLSGSWRRGKSVSLLRRTLLP